MKLCSQSLGAKGQQFSAAAGCSSKQ